VCIHSRGKRRCIYKAQWQCLQLTPLRIVYRVGKNLVCDIFSAVRSYFISTEGVDAVSHLMVQESWRQHCIWNIIKTFNLFVLRLVVLCWWWKLDRIESLLCEIFSV
jgi:hypothetical protein